MPEHARTDIMQTMFVHHGCGQIRGRFFLRIRVNMSLTVRTQVSKRDFLLVLWDKILSKYCCEITMALLGRRIATACNELGKGKKASLHLARIAGHASQAIPPSICRSNS